MILCLEVVQGFMSSFIEKIHASHSYEHHFENRVLDEHTCDNACNRHHVVLDIDGLGLTCEHADEYIRKHGQYIAKIMAYIADTVEAE